MTTVWTETFERPDSGWFLTGGAGFDYGKGLASQGKGNAWVRGTSGWNAINRFHQLKASTWYMAYAYLRQSEGLTDGYFSVREAKELNGNGRILTEQKLAGSSPYRAQSLSFTTPADVSRVLFYIGLWGVGKDVWIQMDDFYINEVGPAPSHGGHGGGQGGTPNTQPSCGVEVTYTQGQYVTVRVFGGGFDGSEQVQIYLNGEEQTTTTASGGSYNVSFSVGQPAQPTHYTVWATGRSSNRTSVYAGFNL